MSPMLSNCKLIEKVSVAVVRGSRIESLVPSRLKHAGPNVNHPPATDPNISSDWETHVHISLHLYFKALRLLHGPGAFRLYHPTAKRGSPHHMPTTTCDDSLSFSARKFDPPLLEFSNKTKELGSARWSKLDTARLSLHELPQQTPKPYRKISTFFANPGFLLRALRVLGVWCIHLFFLCLRGKA